VLTPGSALIPLLLAVAQQSAPVDTTALRNQAQAEARRYEAALRRDAPFGAGGSPGYCDEQVGRFCLWYDHGRQRNLPPEPKPIRAARARAIEAHAAALAALPTDSLLAASLVRYLIEHDSTSGAVSAAQATAAGSTISGISSVRANGRPGKSSILKERTSTLEGFGDWRIHFT